MTVAERICSCHCTDTYRQLDRECPSHGDAAENQRRTPRPAAPIETTCSDCDGTGVDFERRPPARDYLHHPSSMCRECGGRGTVKL